MNKSDSRSGCLPALGCCDSRGGAFGRREFVKGAGLTAAMLMAGRVNIMAGPFEATDFDKIIPANKRLSEAWLASLYVRGEPMSATGSNLKYIGMPISGLCTGQVYLGGDGRLWYWNLTARKDEKHTPKGVRYMQPDIAPAMDDRGFALQVNGKVRTLDASGFREIRFTNRYPMGLVEYADAACPVQVQLEAFTPFIPLNRDESSYPVIVMRYTMKNTSPIPQDVAIAGWIENNANPQAERKVSVYREFEMLSLIECLASGGGSNSLALGLLGKERPELLNLKKATPGAEGVFASRAMVHDGETIERDADHPVFAALGRSFELSAGESRTVSFAVSWCYPLIRYGTGFGKGPKSTSPGRNYYAVRWPTAAQAARQLASRETVLYGATRKWVDTWYDSSLPHWLLERAFIPINCMQTQAAQRIYPEDSNVDHYNLEEGVRCCPGNCTHVWSYAQGLARIFPEIERENRDKIEYGLGFDRRSGLIYFRYTMRENPEKDEAIDGTCGTILRVLRESQMTADYRFLASIWERVKLSMDHVISEWDPDEDGLLAGAQHNTLDEPWYGQVPWLINLYHAALKASALMARQMKQPAVAERYDRIVEKGMPAMVDLLWNEEFGYFIHRPGEAEDQKHGSINGCHIDQILGDSWLRNVGIDPILPKEKIRKTLQSLWKYNFTPDVGAFRKVMTGGRWYAAAGDAGLVMCSFPHGRIEPKSGHKNYAGYLNECMTGFEWQVAAHMIWEGMVEEGLAIGKAIYDRYQPEARNPYNEIECSDHYSRAMASYGAYLAACGYRYDGPEEKLAFGPRLNPENFRAAFTAAEGWGRFTQKVDAGKQVAGIEMLYGKLSLKEFALDEVEGVAATQVKCEVEGSPLDASLRVEAKRCVVKFKTSVTLHAGQQMEVRLT